MLTMVVEESEMWDERTREFISIPKTTLNMEHSLIAISKWEAKHQKPFLTKDPKSEDELLDYFRCMTINKNVDPIVYLGLGPNHKQEISSYIASPATATWFSDKPRSQTSSEIPTSELIYYWMLAHTIPFECQKWHINRLLTLIRICNIKAGPKENMSSREVLEQNRALNAARRKKLNTTG